MREPRKLHLDAGGRPRCKRFAQGVHLLTDSVEEVTCNVCLRYHHGTPLNLRHRITVALRGRSITEEQLIAKLSDRYTRDEIVIALRALEYDQDVLVRMERVYRLPQK